MAEIDSQTNASQAVAFLQPNLLTYPPSIPCSFMWAQAPESDAAEDFWIKSKSGYSDQLAKNGLRISSRAFLWC